MRKFVVKTKTEVDVLRKAIKTSGEDAYRAALKAGVTVTILEGDKIQHIHPDGKRVTIGRIAKTNNKVLPTRIRLK